MNRLLVLLAVRLVVLAVLASGCLVAVGVSPVALAGEVTAVHTPSIGPSIGPSHVLGRRPRPVVRVSASATARVTRHVTARGRSSFTATVTAHSVARTRGGRPISSATARAHVVAGAEARAVGRATATARAAGQGSTRREARVHAVRNATREARTLAAAEALRRARPRAKTLALARALALAKQRARALARHRALLRTVRAPDVRTWLPKVAGDYTPATGPLFNNPYGTLEQRRMLINHVISSIDSSPGYVRPRNPRTHQLMPCPSEEQLWPSRIRIAVYSISDARFAAAIVRAQDRCVSVQVMMNSHLTTVTSPAYGLIQRALGTRRGSGANQRSFAQRCSHGCLGTAVMHSKIYLFSQAGRARNVVVTGSSNMTQNAVGVQWNDLFTVANDRRLYDQYTRMYDKMVPDRRANGPWVFRDGRYTSTFYPDRRATPRTDKTMRDLRSITCTGARGGTGIKGRTVLWIAMHSWYGPRGMYLAQQVRRLYRQGCYVRILYSFLSHRIYDVLTDGTGDRMLARRVMFSGPWGVTATKYSHLKMYAASGHIGRDHRASVVWTGSNNWSDKGLHSDEVTLRIASRGVYDQYVAHWRFIRAWRSSARWAMFLEPQGGGRAP